MTTRDVFLKSLANTTLAARNWFWASTAERTREEYFAKGKLGDAGKGAVYVYLNAHHEPLYVGEAGRPIKRRMHDLTSPHKKATWWNEWTTVRLLAVHDRTDRLTLELLLILGCKPQFNRKPGACEVEAMFQNLTLVGADVPQAARRST